MYVYTCAIYDLSIKGYNHHVHISVSHASMRNRNFFIKSLSGFLVFIVNTFKVYLWNPQILLPL